MFRFLYYKGYIDILEIDMLLELKKDIYKDFEQDMLESHQFEYLINKLNEKLPNTKILCV